MIKSTVHKDPYENIYCVVSGKKEFILHPPTDLPWIPYKKYPTAIYKEVEKGKWVTNPLKNANGDLPEKDLNEKTNENLVPWIAIDPLNPDYEK